MRMRLKQFSLIPSILCLGGLYIGCDDTPSHCVEMRGDKCCWFIYQDNCIEQEGERITFGQYPQATSDPEPIQWTIVTMSFKGEVYDYLEDGYVYLYLVSDYVLDAKPYNEMPSNGYTWENSSIRTWLNHDFMDTAFNKDEKKYIEKTYFLNFLLYTGDEDKIDDYQAKKVTDDYVFLLSNYDLYQIPRKRNENGVDLFLDRYGLATNYAISAGASVSGENCSHATCYTSWWLRSENLEENVYAPCALPPSSEDNTTSHPKVVDRLGNDATVGVRPAIRIKLPLRPEG